MRKRIVITGGSGSVAQEFFFQGQDSYNIIPLSRQQLDVTNEQRVERCFQQIKPSIIVHAAAMTDVEQCERKPVEAIETNGIGTYFVAKEARKLGVKLIYLSSDYVFDGQKLTPYEEDARPRPLSAYGIGKLIGEKFVRSLLNDATIIRTSWLYGGVRASFVRKMIDQGEVNENVQVVNDQIGSPTYVPDLVATMFALLNQAPGTYHVANSGSCSRYELATTIFTLAGFDTCTVQPVTSAQFQLQAPRPTYSVLSSKKLNEIGIEMRHWKQALEDYMRREGFCDRRGKGKRNEKTL